MSLLEFEFAQIFIRRETDDANFCVVNNLKDPSRPPPFSILLKLLTFHFIIFHNNFFTILHGEAKPYCFTVSCVPESLFNYLW